MEVLVFLVPLALMLGGIGLMGFLWSLNSGQYDDLDGAAWRAIADDEPARETPQPQCDRTMVTVHEASAATLAETLPSSLRNIEF